MLFLYHSYYDPRLYQSQGGTRSGGFAETHKFGKYEFRPISLQTEKDVSSVLYVLNPSEVTSNTQVLKTFYSLNGKEAIKIIRTLKK